MGSSGIRAPVHGLVGGNEIMGGQACIRDTRVPVSLIINMIANGASNNKILRDYEYLDEDDIRQTLKYAAWMVEDRI